MTKKLIDLEYIKAEVSEIKIISGDNEAAHESEDVLWMEVLEAIADGTCPDPKACAAEALKTRDIKFTRWYA